MDSNLTEYFRASEEMNNVGPFGDTDGGDWLCEECASGAENVDTNSVTPRQVGADPDDLDLIHCPKCGECGERWNGGK